MVPPRNHCAIIINIVELLFSLWVKPPADGAPLSRGRRMNNGANYQLKLIQVVSWLISEVFYALYTVFFADHFDFTAGQMKTALDYTVTK